MPRWEIYSKGQKFENFILIENYDSIKIGTKGSCRAWICKCDHGIEFVASTKQIKSRIARCPCNIKERKKHRYPRKSIFKSKERFNNFIVVCPSDQRVFENKRSYLAWNCLCDCGKEFIAHSKSIKKRLSCGCLNYENRMKPIYNDFDSNLRTAIKQYKSGAKIRNLEFNLTESECYELFTNPCHYCGGYPERNVRNVNRKISTKVTGIDRKDSKIGYFSENVVSCCSICNRAKGNSSYEEFLRWIQRIKKTAPTSTNDINQSINL